jgi:hypothetical protein
MSESKIDSNEAVGRQAKICFVSDLSFWFSFHLFSRFNNSLAKITAKGAKERRGKKTLNYSF